MMRIKSTRSKNFLMTIKKERSLDKIIIQCLPDNGEMEISLFASTFFLSF